MGSGDGTSSVGDYPLAPVFTLSTPVLILTLNQPLPLWRWTVRNCAQEPIRLVAKYAIPRLPTPRVPEVDSIIDPSEDATDTIGAESAMQYLEQLQIQFDDASMFLALYVLKAENIGELKKDGFVQGWKDAGVEANLTSQKNYFTKQVTSMGSDPKTFKEVYRHAFVLGKEGEARALSLEMATTFWQILFKEPGRPWVGKKKGIDWLSEWLAFLDANWKRTVSKDMWNQAYEFAVKSIEDESLSFWSEDGAWPGVIDQFVAWYQKKAASEDMEVDS